MSLYGDDERDEVLPIVAIGLGVIGAGMMIASGLAAGAIVMVNLLAKRGVHDGASR